MRDMQGTTRRVAAGRALRLALANATDRYAGAKLWGREKSLAAGRTSLAGRTIRGMAILMEGEIIPTD
jgi:hypothetical protein